MTLATGHVSGSTSLAVLLTPPGSGAIAVIRLSGPMTKAFASAHLSRPPKPGRCVHADLRSGDQVVDDIVIVQTDHQSFDLNVHGGPYVTKAVLDLAQRFGFVIGEWQSHASVTLDAADDIQQHMLIDLPRAKSEVVLRLLTAQPAAWRLMLDRNDLAAMKRALADVSLERALAIPTVAIVGPPNVGKSTLANALFGQDRSIIADRPGTTRDWVGELADLDGLVVRLIDTPGVRETADAIEAQAIRQAGGVINSADCIVVALDGSRPLDQAERNILNQWKDQKPLVILSKADRPILCDVTDADLNVCAITGVGLAELRQNISRRLGIVDLGSLTARCWTNGQRQVLSRRLADASAGV